MTLANEEIQRIKELVNNILVSMYGPFNVWTVEIDELEKEMGGIIVNGTYDTNMTGTRKKSFTIELDETYRLKSFKRN